VGPLLRVRVRVENTWIFGFWAEGLYMYQKQH